MSKMNAFNIDVEYLQTALITHGEKHARELATDYSKSYANPPAVASMFNDVIDDELARDRD